MNTKRMIAEKIKSLLKDRFIIVDRRLSDSFDFRKDLSVDNEEFNMLLYFVENFFRINIDSNEEASISNVADLSNVVYNKIGHNDQLRMIYGSRN